MNSEAILSFYRGKRVLITGHTGFKGTWLCRMLAAAGAEVTGFALAPPAGQPALFSMSDTASQIHSVIGDIRQLDVLQQAFQAAAPEVVFHLAAQPIVRESYRDPVGTYASNVMGTVHLLECVRQADSVRSVVNVTTDKVYRNNEWVWGYREEDALDGYEPYSNSKSCSELVTASYRRSFLAAKHIPVSTARAGNVIGGGDFAKDRIIPDCIRAAQAGKPVEIRNPHAVRPFQHVLEPLSVYLALGQMQAEAPELAGCYNIGPEERDCVTAGQLVSLFCSAWGEGAAWKDCSDPDAPHEAGLLKLDCAKSKALLGWKPTYTIQTAVEKTVAFAKACAAGTPAGSVMDAQIADYWREQEHV